jgi:magnesium transporter
MQSPLRPAIQGEASSGSTGSKKKKHRAGRKRKNRRQSFAAPSEENDEPMSAAERPGLEDVPEAPHEPSFYKLGNRATKSNESLESEALLDHR